SRYAMPTRSAPPAQARPQSGPVVFTEGHRFQLTGDTSIDGLLAQLTAPLSVIVQVTKRCDFDCNFCSEILQLPDPTPAQLDRMRANLAGVQRVFLSGGEPLMRKDFGDIVDMYSEFILGIPTNATKALHHAARLANKVAYVNVIHQRAAPSTSPPRSTCSPRICSTNCAPPATTSYSSPTRRSPTCSPTPGYCSTSPALPESATRFGGSPGSDSGTRRTRWPGRSLCQPTPASWAADGAGPALRIGGSGWPTRR
ncbi:MAG: radical SAM protein, partial [Pseudonocardiaceae bacterium]